MKENGADEAKIKSFQKGVQEYYTKKIVPNFDDLDFYTGESMDPDGMCVLFRSRPKLLDMRLMCLSTGSSS